MQVTHIENGKKLHIDGNELRDEAGKLVAREIEVERTLSDVASNILTRDLGVSSVTSGRTEAAFGVTALGAVADLAAPVVLTSHTLGTYFRESPDDAIKPVLPGAVAGGAQAPEVHPNVNGTTFETVGYGVAVPFAVQTLKNSDFDVATMAIERAASAHRIGREMRVARLLTASTNWTAANVIAPAAAAKWNGGAASDPIADLFAAALASVLPVTRIVMSEIVAHHFWRNPNTVGFIQAGGQLPPISVARLKIGGMGYAWGGTYAVCICEPETPTSLSTARTLRWDSKVSDGETKTNGIIVRQWFESDIGSRGRKWATVIVQDAEVMVGPSLGALVLAVQ